jgi:hypothetical protein
MLNNVIKTKPILRADGENIIVDEVNELREDENKTRWSIDLTYYD